MIHWTFRFHGDTSADYDVSESEHDPNESSREANEAKAECEFQDAFPRLQVVHWAPPGTWLLDYEYQIYTAFHRVQALSVMRVQTQPVMLKQHHNYFYFQHLTQAHGRIVLESAGPPA